MDAIIQQVLTTVSSIAVVAATALINQRMKDSDRKADERHAEAEAERLRRDAWREGISARLGKLERDIEATKEASQVNMRQNLIHYAEKYITRGWITSEERKAFVKRAVVFFFYSKICLNCFAGELFCGFVDALG